MNNVLTRCASSLLVVTLAAGGGVALTSLAHAQSAPGAPATAAPPMPQHPPMGPGGGMRGGREWRELDRLKTSLKLDATQQALWDRALERMKPQGDTREQMRARRDRMAALVDDPNFDPRRLAAEMDAAEADQRAKRNAVRDAWFTVYDSLNPTQRGQAREFLRSRMSRHHGGMHDGPHDGRMGGMHGHDGEPGRPPMPPGPPASR